MTREILDNLEVFLSFDFNEIQNRRRAHKEASFINKARKIITKRIDNQNIGVEIKTTSESLVIILTDLTQQLSTFPQHVVFKVAKVSEKLTRKNKNFIIYSILPGSIPKKEFSLHEETDKIQTSFLKINSAIGIGGSTKRDSLRRATINLVSRERISIDLAQELGSQELKRRKLDVEDVLVKHEFIQKLFVVFCLLIFGGSSPLGIFNYRDSFSKSLSSASTSKSEELNPKANSLQKSDSLKTNSKTDKNTNNKSKNSVKSSSQSNSFVISLFFIGMAVVLGIIELVLLWDMAKRKDQVSLLKYALEMNIDSQNSDNHPSTHNNLVGGDAIDSNITIAKYETQPIPNFAYKSQNDHPTSQIQSTMAYAPESPSNSPQPEKTIA